MPLANVIEKDEPKEDDSEVQTLDEITEEKLEDEGKFPEVFFSPKKVEDFLEEEKPTFRQTVTPVKNKEEKKSPLSLFSKVVNSVNFNFKKKEEEKDEIYILDQDKQIADDDSITDEMLNVPAYQRKKKLD